MFLLRFMRTAMVERLQTHIQSHTHTSQSSPWIWHSKWVTLLKRVGCIALLHLTLQDSGDNWTSLGKCDAGIYSAPLGFLCLGEISHWWRRWHPPSSEKCATCMEKLFFFHLLSMKMISVCVMFIPLWGRTFTLTNCILNQWSFFILLPIFTTSS